MHSARIAINLLCSNGIVCTLLCIQERAESGQSRFLNTQLHDFNLIATKISQNAQTRQVNASNSTTEPTSVPRS